MTLPEPEAIQKHLQQKGVHSFVKAGIAVIDFGGQYAHLIASRIRRLGAYSEILQPDEVGDNLDSFYKGIIFSGGPSSVYDAKAPATSPKLLKSGVPILGICYGHQLIAMQLGGEVRRGDRREYGPAKLNLLGETGLLKHESNGSTVWMSHGDEVAQLPDGFEIIATTSSCKHTAVYNADRNIYGLQFHPEVSHTGYGETLLRNFISICGLSDSWTIDAFGDFERQRIRSELNNKKVFFLVSGGVDSTVAFALLGSELDSSHLKGMLVDTGFLRDNEARSVQSSLSKIGVDLHVFDARHRFLEALAKVHEPEQKRKIIGELFIDVQQEVSQQMGLDKDEWLLGQGTIYPDTIESGGTKSSNTIKTHHNRVGRIQEMIEQGRVVEPLRDLYKDEVRHLGRLIGLPDDLVDRHPFPGPGLAVRCLCTGADESATSRPFTEIKTQPELAGLLERLGVSAHLLPLRSVGVQGDQRTYAHPLALHWLKSNHGPVSWSELFEISARLPGSFAEVNRVLLKSGDADFDNQGEQIDEQRILLPGRFLTEDRIKNLQVADAIVNEFLHEKKIYSEIWQMPVVLIPIGRSRNIGPKESIESKESIVLRPICSTDAMTASVYEMNDTLLNELTQRILATKRFDAIYYDLTSKPPGTIEWE